MVFGNNRRTNQPFALLKALPLTLPSVLLAASLLTACGENSNTSQSNTSEASQAPSGESHQESTGKTVAIAPPAAETSVEKISRNMLKATVKEAAAPAGVIAVAAHATPQAAQAAKKPQDIQELANPRQKKVTTQKAIEVIPGEPLMTYTLEQDGQTSSLQAMAIGANKTITANTPMATVTKPRTTSTSAGTPVTSQTSGTATLFVAAAPIEKTSSIKAADPNPKLSTEPSPKPGTPPSRKPAGDKITGDIDAAVAAAFAGVTKPSLVTTEVPTAEKMLPTNNSQSMETVVVSEETSALVSVTMPSGTSSVTASSTNANKNANKPSNNPSNKNQAVQATVASTESASAKAKSEALPKKPSSDQPEEQKATDTAGQRTFMPIYDANTLNLVCDATLRDMEAAFKELGSSDIADANVESILHVWNKLSANFENSEGPLYLQTYVSPDAAVREAGEACIVKLGEFNTGLFQRRDLYERVKEVVASDRHSKAMRKDLLDAFDDNGIGLPTEKQERLKALKKEIQELSQAFSRTVRENDSKLTFGKDELKGLPESYLERVGTANDGSITVGFDYPDVFPFLNNAESEPARKRYLTEFSRRGTPENIVRLDKIMQLRKELAGLFDLPSYAHLITQRRMVENPETVTTFLDTVENKLREVELNDVAQLRTLKAELTGKPENSIQVQQWDKSYLKEQLRKQRFSIDQEALRENFPMPAVVDWGLWIASDLYGIKFERQAVPLWHEDVLYYDVLDSDSGEFLGGIYLDLYPRDGKYKHAAAFGVRGGSKLINRRPISVLVTNFDRKGLTHNELETFLHELGHVFHGVLTQTDYLAHAGTSVKRDFVEAPSQMFEAWARSPQTLSKITDFCDGCPALDEATIDRLQQARNFGRGLDYSRQHLYASYDMRLAGEAPEPSLQTWYEMEGSTPLGVLPHGEFPGAFGHIAGGYAAGYYGYMWSEVLAIDMLSAFGDNLMDRAVGKRFRDIILGEGGQRPPKELVSEFLGREPNPAAFFAEITGNGK